MDSFPLGGYPIHSWHAHARFAGNLRMGQDRSSGWNFKPILDCSSWLWQKLCDPLWRISLFQGFSIHHSLWLAKTWNEMMIDWHTIQSTFFIVLFLQGAWDTIFFMYSSKPPAPLWNLVLCFEQWGDGKFPSSNSSEVTCRFVGRSVTIHVWSPICQDETQQHFP